MPIASACLKSRSELGKIKFPKGNYVHGLRGRGDDMAEEYAERAATGDTGEAVLLAVFATLTPKQHEVLALVAENRTSKEIAWRLGVSESAVNQRIESVRSRVGFPPRAQLARVYRQQYQAGPTSKTLTDQILHLPQSAASNHQAEQQDRPDTFMLADPQTFEVAAPWQRRRSGLVLPEVLDGPGSGLNRVAAMFVIAAGLLTVAMVGLGVAQALTALF